MPSSSRRPRIALAAVALVGVATIGVLIADGGSGPAEGTVEEKTERPGNAPSRTVHARPVEREKSRRSEPGSAPTSKPPAAPGHPPTAREREAIRRDAEESIRENPTLRNAPPEIRERLLEQDR